ncbi:isoprenoid synthase domain-containing protein [Infundibulicybe gibba]|nr:isoprenoid synthase domain-containing protein [Infundibulicybe gibba]
MRFPSFIWASIGKRYSCPSRKSICPAFQLVRYRGTGCARDPRPATGHVRHAACTQVSKISPPAATQEAYKSIPQPLRFTIRNIPPISLLALPTKMTTTMRIQAHTQTTAGVSYGPQHLACRLPEPEKGEIQHSDHYPVTAGAPAVCKPLLPKQAVDVETIRNVLMSFLREMNTPFPTITYSPSFAESSSLEALRLGFQVAHVRSPEFQRALQPSSAACLILYPHLAEQARFWICIYTACVIHFDDIALQGGVEVFADFNAAFLASRTQRHPLLDDFARLLRMAGDHFSATCANLIITNTLDYITALILEHEQRDMLVHNDAVSYPEYLRSLTGIARPYALFLFPPHIPVQDYIQILPDMIHYLEDVNDIFSFYKEELEGEVNNLVSLIAKVTSGPNEGNKIEALKYLVERSVSGARRIAKVLESKPEAHAIVTKNFLVGYIGVYALSRQRYKLDDLDLA